jgi:uncharacterized protein CbrC (UPF0167 family)
MKGFRVKKARKSKFFQGEMMICVHCGRKQKSDPNVSSEWTVVELDGRALYFCPWCFGNARAAGLGAAP